RLDKFLKISRIIKRRTVAKEIADKGRITVNDRPAKSATNITVGDLLVINFGNKILRLKVLSVKETAKKDEASELYQLIAEEFKEDYRK
ncbi:MAG: RNA-binding S4 domain-containing protein, partial [Liquorilactobacillus satsumensis]